MSLHSFPSHKCNPFSTLAWHDLLCFIPGASCSPVGVCTHVRTSSVCMCLRPAWALPLPPGGGSIATSLLLCSGAQRHRHGLGAAGGSHAALSALPDPRGSCQGW